MKKIFPMICSILFVLYACKKNDVERAPYLEITEEGLTALQQPFGQKADNRLISLNTNIEGIKVSSLETWCKVSIVEENGTFLHITMLPNDGFSERSTEITLYGKGVPEIKATIKQIGSEPTLVVSTEQINLEDENLEFKLHITTNVEFHFVLPDWIEELGNVKPTVGSETYSFTASTMLPGERTGEIKIITEEYEELDLVVTIMQTQQVLYPELTLFSPETAGKGDKVVLNGKNFGTTLELVEVYFDDKLAEITKFTENAIDVIVPRGLNGSSQVSVVIAGEKLKYDNDFVYTKSWGLHRLTGNGTPNFKSGSLDEAQFRARYIAVDDNETIIASQTDDYNGRHVIKVSKTENSVISLASQASTGNHFLPDAPEVLPNGVFYVANDRLNATSYYKFDPANNWVPEPKVLNYNGGPQPPASSFMYRMVYNKHDGYLYAFIGSPKALVVKIDPATNNAEIFYEYNQNTWWYAPVVHPTNPNLMYAPVNSAAAGYGLYMLNMNDMDAGFLRLNSNGKLGVATPNELKSSLADTGFGQTWGMVFGKDGKLYIADYSNHIIRRLDLTSNTLETIIGVAGEMGDRDGNKETARLNGPRGMAWNKDGTILYISDYLNSKIKEWAFD